ncbi:metallophosphoesterase family protein [Carboxylicivirga linearis]|uniref:Metallophosphoesterase n=1 Tax=Carboxylicivirga linearis TaxID=1628157 RepID=A0ABS5JUD7_9BACT|nr:metallophosphoesterase [Carboxylicivirga linearis]MBS2098479.1 metallophosphoesterase [Carboxylicivirga linearis]
MRKENVYFLLGLLLMMSSCDEWIEFSPYENRVKEIERNQNLVSYNRLIDDVDKPYEPFKVGLIADTHTYYDEFEKQVAFINTLNDLDFIIHLGDITLSSNIREFRWYSDIVNQINIPVFTIIGNHDCLGNGFDIYTEMFGDNNFFFTHKGVKFVMFDDVFWEKQIKDPDFEWFYHALENTDENKYVIPFAHIGPWSSQFPIGNKYLYNEMMEFYNIPLSVHGHDHRYDLKNPYGEVNYLTVPSCNRDELIVLDFKADTLEVERILY